MHKIIYFKEKADSTLCILSVLYITSLLTNLAVGYRYIQFGSLIQSGGVFIFPISFIISDIITEVYGSHLAKKLVNYGILCQFIFALYAHVVSNFPAPYFLKNQEAFSLVFIPYLKFALASSISIWVGSKVNIFLLSKLSEYVGGSYFAARSFFASTAGEFLVTLISMLLANFNNINLSPLIYMIACCFSIKTLISIIAIFPASLVVHALENKRTYQFKFLVDFFSNPIGILKNLGLIAWNAKGYIYNLETINLETKKATFYYKGTRGLVQLHLSTLFFTPTIISKIRAMDAAHIGYYCSITDGLTKPFLSQENSFNSNTKPTLLEGTLNILAIERDGKLLIQDTNRSLKLKKCPIDIYNNPPLLESFSSSQALYIGYLSGKSNLVKDKINPRRPFYLQVIK